MRPGGPPDSRGPVCCCQRRQLRIAAAVVLATVLLVAASLAASLSLLALQSSSSTSSRSIIDQQVDSAQKPPADSASTPDEDEQEGTADGRLLLRSQLGHLLPAGDKLFTGQARFHPASFLSENPVLNSTVYCNLPASETALLDVFYSEPTWLCKNARVGNRRLPFTDTTTRNQDDLVLLRKLELDLAGPQLPNEMCGRLPERGNNVFLLCELLLASLIDRTDYSVGQRAAIKSSSVHVPFGNCSLPENGRAILVGNSAETAAWHREDRLWPGFIVDIYCSFPLPSS